MVVIPSTLVVVTGPGAVTDLALEIVQTDLVLVAEIDLGEVDLGLEIDQVTDLVVVRDLAQEVEAVKDPVQEQDQARGQVQDLDQVRDKDQVQDQVRDKDQVQDQVREQGQLQGQVRDKVVPELLVGGGPLAATRAGALLPGTVSVVDPVVLANQDQDRQGVP